MCSPARFRSSFAHRPSAAPISPPDELDARIPLLHRACEIDGGRNGLIALEGPVAIRSLVADLPQLEPVRLDNAVLPALLVVRIVRIGNPVSGLAGIPRAIPFSGIAESRFPVAQKIDTIKRLGSRTPAEVHKLVRAYPIGLLAAPEVVPHPRPFVRRAHAFTPFVMAAEQPAKAHRPRCKIADGIDKVLPPVVTIVIPGRFH